MNYINNWLYTLNAPIPTGDGALPVSAAALTRLGLDGGVEYTLTLAEDDGSAHEIIQISGASGGSYSLLRGQEGTLEREWPMGAQIYCSITAGQLSALAPSDSGWITVPALNAFEYPPQARRLNGVVYLRGFQWLDATALGTEIAQLPAGWWPTEKQQVFVTNGARTRRVIVKTTGAIQVSDAYGDGASEYITFDSIVFPLG